MPPKRKSTTKETTHGRKERKSTKKESSPENDSEGEEGIPFDKKTLQRNVKFDFEKLMTDPVFQHPEFVVKMEPEDLTVEHYEKNGLEKPIHFRCDPKRIGMK
ncbi:hypothetical protein GCK72_010703 [Caenorhabditis remanei]|uniref:Uncharacterized protein n=1 Tax=Caenorhabditis remanei TaxID=31234 RepID=A0A6A5H6B7_CAERE|nr:hypothetical protein GCK72_010703 [Caenorhabditis remanei]KAF1762441.1 hypothetical protein GCK72_010703 [Caenorhabditis remanei]